MWHKLLLLLLLRVRVAVTLLSVLALVQRALLSSLCAGTGGRALQCGSVLCVEALEAAFQPCHFHTCRRCELRRRRQTFGCARVGTDVRRLLRDPSSCRVLTSVTAVGTPARVLVSVTGSGRATRRSSRLL